MAGSWTRGRSACTRRSSTRATAGACRSTSTPASVARRARWPARPRTTCPSSARPRRPTAAQRALAAAGAMGRGQSCPPAQHVPADVLPALRGGAVRAGVPGVRGLPDRGRAERAGLQPLRRDPVLRQQLPLSRAPLQLVELRVAGAARGAAQPRRHSAAARRDGEVHDVHPAHRGRQGSRAGREARRSATATSRPPASRRARPRPSPSATSRTRAAPWPSSPTRRAPTTCWRSSAPAPA